MNGGGKSWYLQNVKNDGTNKIFRIGVHDEGSKLDIHKNGNAYFTGEINTPNLIVNGRNLLKEFDNFVNNIAVRRDKKYGINSDRGGYLKDGGGWAPNIAGGWETMKFIQI